MKVFLFLVAVFLSGGFLVTAVIWCIFWISGVLTPPPAVFKIFRILITPRYPIEVFDLPALVESGSITAFLRTEKTTEGLVIMMGTSTGAIAFIISEEGPTRVNTYAAAP